MKILYFARIRQLVGRGSDDIDIPDRVKTVRELMEFLSAGDPGVAAAFADSRTIKAAINQSHVPLEAPIAGATEVAFFPPVTGG